MLRDVFFGFAVGAVVGYLCRKGNVPAALQVLHACSFYLGKEALRALFRRVHEIATDDCDEGCNIH